jgi:hypothetical protein
LISKTSFLAQSFQGNQYRPEERILEDALSCNLHKIGASLIEKVVDAGLHTAPISQATQDRVQFKAHTRVGKDQQKAGDGQNVQTVIERLPFSLSFP